LGDQLPPDTSRVALHEREVTTIEQYYLEASFVRDVCSVASHCRAHLSSVGDQREPVIVALCDSDLGSNVVQRQLITGLESNIPSAKREMVATKNHVHIFAPPPPRHSMQETDRTENGYSFRFERVYGCGS
jgi:REP element-mobilizing transposase RayT